MARSDAITERQAKIDGIVDCVISTAVLHSEGAPDCEPKDAADHIHRRAGDIAITSDAMAAAAAALRKSPVHTAYCRQVADAIDGEKGSFDILPGLKAGDSHFTEASQCALTCTQDLQLLDGLTPPVRRPKHCGRR